MVRHTQSLQLGFDLINFAHPTPGIFKTAGLTPKRSQQTSKRRALSVRGGKLTVHKAEQGTEQAYFRLMSQEAATWAAERHIQNGPGLLWVTGATGLGKTTLLRHCATLLHAALPAKQPICMVSGAELLQRYHAAEGVRQFSSFVCELGELPGALLLDDADLLFKSTSMQYYFSFALDRLIDRGVCVIFSGTKDLKNAKLDERLAHRLLKAERVYLAAPSVEERHSFLEQHMAHLGLNKAQNADATLLSKTYTNYAALVNGCQHFSPEAAAASSTGAKKPEAKDVLERMRKHFKVGMGELKGTSREKRLIPARHAAMHILHRKLGLSLEQVATIFKRDHSTVLHGVQRIDELLLTDAALNSLVNEFSN